MNPEKEFSLFVAFTFSPQFMQYAVFNSSAKDE